MLSLRPIDHRSGGNNSSDTSSSSNQFRGYSQYPGLYASPYHSSFSSAVYPTSTSIHNFSDLSEIRDLRMPSTSGASSALSMAHDSDASTMHDAYRNHLQGHYNMNMAAHTNGAAPAGGNNANDASHTNSASQGAINTQFPMAMPRPMGMYATENFSRASLPSPTIPASSTTNEAEDIKPSDLNNTTSPNGAPSPSGTDSTSPEASTPLSHHRSRSGPMRSRVVSRVPEEKKDATYWDKRKKNNESAKRSREQRKKKEETKEMQLAEYRRKEMAWSMERTLLVADNNRLRAVLHQNNIPAPPSMMNPGEMQVDQLYSPATNPALYQQLMQQQQQQQQQQALQLNTNT